MRLMYMAEKPEYEIQVDAKTGDISRIKREVIGNQKQVMIERNQLIQQIISQEERLNNLLDQLKQFNTYLSRDIDNRLLDPVF